MGGAYIYPFVWGSEGNYPAGANPWNSQPLAVLPAQDYFVPGTYPPAETLNWCFQQLGFGMAYLYGSKGAPGQNWGVAGQPNTTIGTSDLCVATAAAWDPLSSRWLLVVTDTITSQSTVVASYGLDGVGSSSITPWSNVSTGFLVTGNQVPVAVSPDPSTQGKYWAAVISTTSTTDDTLTIYAVANPSSGWGSSTSVEHSGAEWLDAKFAVLGSRLVCAVLSNTIGDSAFMSWNGTTWTSDYASFLGFSVANTEWLIKSNGSMILAFPRGVAANAYSYTTPDGHTWTQNTVTFLGAHDAVAGLCWHTALGLWVAAVQTNTNVSPASTQFYSSPDGVNWTKIGTNGPVSLFITDMEYLAGSLVCTLADATNSGPSGQIFSIDGGVTWYFSQAGFDLNESSASEYYQRSQLARGGVGLLAFNSLRVRFSSLAGLPPSALPT